MPCPSCPLRPDKIIEASVLYDRYHPSAVQLDAFNGSVMAPHVFKEQLRRVFNVHLSPKELGAIMDHFDKDGSGEVDCAEFLLEFFKLGKPLRPPSLRGGPAGEQLSLWIVLSHASSYSSVCCRL